MKKLSIYLFVYSVLGFMFSSCQEVGQDDLNDAETELIEYYDPDNYESRLLELTVFMGEVLKDPEARKELFDFAKLKGNENDVEYSLKRLFETDQDPFSKSKSAIVRAFRKNVENHRIMDEDFDENELIDFISKENIGVLAPYLAKNFDPSTLTEITVSWWTEEMEEEGLANDPEWQGETPGIKFDLDTSNDFIQFRKNKSLKIQNREVLMTNDSYAMENPTVVFGAFNEDEFNEDELILSSPGVESERSSTFTTGVPHDMGIGCDDVLPNDVVRYHMPQFRLAHKNTRSWPKPNRISIWVAYGTYGFSGGFPTPSVTVNLILNDQKIDRGDFHWQQERWPVLMTSWPESRESIQIIIAHRKSNRTVSEQTTAVTINPQTGETQVTSGQKVEKDDYQLFFSQTWQRCDEINGAHKIPVPPLYTTRFNNAIWEYSSPNGTCQFTLEPRLTRL